MNFFESNPIDSQESFSPPDFGITILGASHGTHPFHLFILNNKKK